MFIYIIACGEDNAVHTQRRCNHLIASTDMHIFLDHSIEDGKYCHVTSWEFDVIKHP